MNLIAEFDQQLAYAEEVVDYLIGRVGAGPKFSRLQSLVVEDIDSFKQFSTFDLKLLLAIAIDRLAKYE
ncbi:hypothetical protein SEA_BOBBY_150 [Mycobacterium phage Bobby]|nr:hypothetical protein SEA_BOBBY_150 [Mycobacterium phage Bobby]